MDMTAPQRPAMPDMPKMGDANCYGPAVRPVGFEPPQAPDMKARVEQMRAGMEAQNAERQAAMQARLGEMKAAMEARRSEMQANCKQM